MTASVPFWPAFFVLTPASLCCKWEQIKLDTLAGILANHLLVEAGRDHHQQGKVGETAAANEAEFNPGGAACNQRLFCDMKMNMSDLHPLKSNTFYLPLSLSKVAYFKRFSLFSLFEPLHYFYLKLVKMISDTGFLPVYHMVSHFRGHHQLNTQNLAWF